MSAVGPFPATLTTDGLLALPGDGMARELIRGGLRERPETARDRWYGRT